MIVGRRLTIGKQLNIHTYTLALSILVSSIWVFAKFFFILLFDLPGKFGNTLLKDKKNMTILY